MKKKKMNPIKNDSNDILSTTIQMTLLHFSFFLNYLNTYMTVFVLPPKESINNLVNTLSR